MNPEEIKALLDAQAAALQASFQTTLQAAVAPIQTELAALKAKPEPKPDPKPDPKTDPKPEPKKDEKPTPAQNAELLSLKQSVDSLQQTVTEERAKREEAEKRSREAAKSAEIERSVSGIKFANDKSRELFVGMLAARATQLDDGSIVADNLPLAKFVERELPSYAGLLQPTQSRGSGAANPGVQTGKKPTDLNEIKPGMKDDALQAALDDIRGNWSR